MKIPRIPEGDLVQDVISDTLSTGLVSEVSRLEETQQQQFYNWLLGKEQEEPEFVSKLVSNLAYKVNISMGFLSATAISRLFRLNSFMTVAEDQLFSPDCVSMYTSKELAELYKTASATIMQTMEFIRRYLAQNQDSLNFDTNDESAKINKILSTFTPDKLSQIIAFLESKD